MTRVVLSLLGVALIFFGNFSAYASPRISTAVFSKALAAGISERAVQLAFGFYETTELENSHFISIVDFTKPSYEKRLFIISLDPTNDASIESFYVSHGINSGAGPWVHSVSNSKSSLQSSPGLYVTGKSFTSKKTGLSMVMQGMEPDNSQAPSRGIWFHGSNGLDDLYIADHGQARTSEGCFMVDHKINDQLIAKLKGGSIFYVYWDKSVIPVEDPLPKPQRPERKRNKDSLPAAPAEPYDPCKDLDAPYSPSRCGSA
jgi:hypothetical protein